ncbi:melanopsin-B-like [Actinia tenebrosa]|uniref:Melanopsin-B-like n=1 Tax=Actinia tenebrosa TaxID=6105 RepID=A0A6P8HUF4_ACTTE|nr:melanopsin-B-like [Actinia tenebrosa]
MSDRVYNKRMAYELAYRTLAQIITESSFLILIAVIGFLGNSCVLYVFYKSSRLRSITNYYLIVLAISDITMTTVVMPTTIAVAMTGRDVIGVTVGQVIGIFTYTLVFGSLQTTSLIAVNRFFCITKPSVYRKYFKPRPAIIMIIGAWLFAISNIALVYVSAIQERIFCHFFPSETSSSRNRATEESKSEMKRQDAVADLGRARNIVEEKETV